MPTGRLGVVGVEQQFAQWGAGRDRGLARAPAHRGAREPRQRVVVGRQVQVIGAQRLRRCAARRRGRRFEHRHLPATAREAGRDGGARQAGADHQRAARWPVRRFGGWREAAPARRVARAQPMRLAGLGLDLVRSISKPACCSASRTTSSVERVASAAPGRARRASDRIRPAVPHARIARRRKAVEEERIGAQPQPGHERRRIAQAQAQRDRTGVEAQRVHAGQCIRPLREQRARVRRRRAQRVQRSPQVVGGERMRFDRHVVQARRDAGAFAPGLQRGQEVHPETEAELDDGERRAAGRVGDRGPAPRQLATVDEHRARLRPGAGTAAEHVAIERARRRPRFVEDQRWMGDRHGQPPHLKLQSIPVVDARRGPRSAARCAVPRGHNG